MIGTVQQLAVTVVVGVWIAWGGLALVSRRMRRRESDLNFDRDVSHHRLMRELARHE